MIRILVFGMTENPGGVERFLLNYYSFLDRTKIQFDFLCNTLGTVAFEKELLGNGARIFKIAPRKQNPVRYLHDLKQVFRQHASEWDAVWVNVNSLANIDYLRLAKRFGIRRRIIHSHNSQNMDNVLRGVLHHWNKRRLGNCATDFWACSTGAAEWFYSGTGCSPVRIIPNAINIRDVEFDGDKRKEIRSAIGAADSTYVIGDIGRLHFQKNQRFLIRVFAEYQKLDADSLLVIVGQGEDREKLENLCRELGIEERVRFTGVQKDIQGMLSAFDLFLFPSLFEGLAIAALEAQANGVPVLASEHVIPDAIRLNGNCRTLSLNCPASEWALQVESMKATETRADRDAVESAFRKSGYDISTEARKLERLLTQ